jgi:hypothetical protein
VNDQPVFDTAPLERVREGMAVVDESGVRMGKVKHVRMGEPQAVTAAGGTQVGEGVSVAVAPANSPGGTTAFGGGVPFVGAAEEPDLPDPLRTRFRRVGFIELENSELRGADRYIPGDRVREVTDQTVRVGSSAVSPTIGSTESNASVQPSSPTSTGSGEAMLRTRLGTPQYVRSASGPRLLRDWRSAASGGAVAGVAAIASALLYRRQQQRSGPYARLRRSLNSLTDDLAEIGRTRLSGGAGGALLLMLISAALLRRARGRAVITSSPPSEAVPEIVAGRIDSFRKRPAAAAVGVVASALALGIGILRYWRTRQEAVGYIGTPGVESAAGRDRTRSGELPADYGVEHVRR